MVVDVLPLRRGASDGKSADDASAAEETTDATKLLRE
jgi:hypothetical protein